MGIYHQKISPESGQSMPLNAGDVPMYMSLVEQYGLDDLTIGEPGGQEQTIDQEYQGYITAPLTLKSVSALKFWEVGGS